MKKILCPIDFSEASMNGLKYAFETARLFQSDLVLFHSVHIVPEEYLTNDLIFEREEKVRERLEVICEDLARHNHYQGINYWFLIKTGLAVDAILNLIKDNHIDMVIMGTKGAEGADTILGTLSAEVAAKTVCPVVIIPQNYTFKPTSHIVYATDLQGEEESLINYVADLAKKYHAHISVLNIQKEQQEDFKELISCGEEILHVSDYKDMSFHVLEKDTTLEGINSFIENHNADLLVMSARSRSFLQKMLSKSHTRQMAFYTKVPLLVVHKGVVYQD